MDDVTIVARTVAEWNALVEDLADPHGLSTGSQYRGVDALVAYIEDELIFSDLADDDTLEIELPWESYLTILQLEAAR